MVEYGDLKRGMFLIDTLTFQTTWWAYIMKRVDPLGVAILRLSRENDTNHLQIDGFAYPEYLWDKKESAHWTIMDKKDTKIVKKMMIEATFEDSDF
jgi:hypothetical protein